MAYYDAIANAIGARGNALAQGALQSGQVWGNLAANLGQIPGRCIAFHQQRQDALQNHEIKKLALENAQRDAEMDKEAVRIVHSGAPDEQIFAELKRVYSGKPEKFIAIQNLESQHLARQQQVLHQQKMEEHQNFQDQLAFQGAQKGGSGVPVSMPTPTGPDLSRGNALSPIASPIVPLAEPNIPPVRMNPSMQTKFGIVPGQPTAAEELVQKKDLAAFTAGLRTEKPINYSDIEGIVENKAKQYKLDKGVDASPGQRAAWQEALMLQLAQARQQGSPSQMLGFAPDGKPIAYIPSKQGGAGTLGTVGGADIPGGPISPKVTPNLSDAAVKEITQSESAIRLLDELGPLITENKEYIGPFAGTLTTLNPYSRGRQVASDIARVRQRIGKALEGGVLRKEDEEKYKTILANIQDTDENAIYKIEALKADIKADVETYKTNMGAAGRNMSNFPAPAAAPKGGKQPKILKIERIQ